MRFRNEFVGQRIVSQQPVGHLPWQKIVHDDMWKGLRTQENIPHEGGPPEQLRGVKKKGIPPLSIRKGGARHTSRLT